MPAVVGGQFLVSHDQKSDKEHVFEIVITEDTTIKLKTFKDMVSVSVDAKSMDAFEGSIGLLGSHGGQMLARDGVTVLQNDPDAYGQEWQVREEEAGLFMDMDYSPQYPQQCVVPQKDPTSSSRRLGEQSITETQAGDACAVAGRLDDMKECIFDVVATQDLSMADAGAF
ncbi:expressed unknown protein [Seminavis robusta]|uniref:Uncharacterized protein n=1 Tax=Seminavis robusta TaxID=568900 RepID=A0A9N8E7D0_9STRA|nr:expressed unknown protein [Seminavis robusta]|eukprot:Sro730_g194050.1 n/a (170) ;mRNA; f:29460-29969